MNWIFMPLSWFLLSHSLAVFLWSESRSIAIVLIPWTTIPYPLLYVVIPLYAPFQFTVAFRTSSASSGFLNWSQILLSTVSTTWEGPGPEIEFDPSTSDYYEWWRDRVLVHSGDIEQCALVEYEVLWWFDSLSLINDLMEFVVPSQLLVGLFTWRIL